MEEELTEYPKLFLINYFGELRTQIDLCFARKQQRYEGNYFELKANSTKWNEFIQKIDSLEADLLKNVNKLTKYDIKQLQDEEKMLKILFSNQTLVFLNNINETGEKLIYISNECIGKDGIKYLKQR